MAKKKGPPQPRKKSPEELKEEAFQKKCAEAAAAKAGSSAPPLPAGPSGIKVMVRPGSNPDLAGTGSSMKKSCSTSSLGGGMKKSGSALNLAGSEGELSPAEEEALLAQLSSVVSLAELSKALAAPSEKVRRAAGDLAKAILAVLTSEEQTAKLHELMAEATSTDADASKARSAAAMTLAPLLTVMGPNSFGGSDLWALLESASKDKKEPYRKEGASMIIKAMAFYLNRGFEPYVQRAVPLLLSMLSDGSTGVREAACQGVIACMKCSSYLGLGRVVPELVKQVRESKWTCKAGALQLLGVMADIAPKALYLQFPEVMPAVRDSLADTHPKVKEQAEDALKALCTIVEYPEVAVMIDHVQEAIISPIAKMADCIEEMMDITFVNAVDEPPLELVVPILSRALKDRKADLRKKAAKTCGNMCTLVLHPRVLLPHVPSLLPGIQAGLVESQPEVREVCARALTGMVQGMGGPPIYKLLPDLEKLQATMTEANSADERAKAHQAVESLAVDEIGKCMAAIEAESKEEAQSAKESVLKLRSTLKASVPQDLVDTALEHAYIVAEAVLNEAINRPDGKGSHHAPASMAEGLSFLKTYVGEEAAKSIVDQAAEVVVSATSDADGVDASGDERIVDLRNIILAYPGRVLLQRSHLHMDRGHCYGLVGQNGVGKTTIMTRVAQQDIHNFPTHLKCVYVQHEVHRGVNDGESVHQFMKTQVPSETDDAISEALRSVGFSEKMIHGPVVDLSGGWRMKLAIARAMLQRADILLLDEPTNHLDVASVAWLAEYIRSLKNTTVMVVSHDADFMEQVVTDVIHIHDLKLKYYTDGFANFRRQNLWLFPEDGEAEGTVGAETGEGEGADEGGVDKSEPSTSGEKPYGSYDFTSQPFNFPDPGKLEGIKSRKKPVLTMTGISFRYPGAEKDTLSNINVKLALSSRVSLVGANGAGKTTLLRLLVEDLPTNPGQGEVWKHHNLRLAYVAQHSMHHLEANISSTPIAYIQHRFGFGKDKEVENKVTIKLTDEEKEIMNTRGEIGEVMGRRKLSKMIEYEVLRTGRKPEDSQWFNLNDLKLQKPYVMKLAKAYDEKMAAMASGADQRPITIPEIKKHLKDFGINEVLATGKIKNLSGGQKSRLVLAAAMWSRPHLVALDEPTNYIDRETLAALAESLKSFNGGVFIISHNAAFVEEVCNEQWPVHSGTCHPPEKLKGKDKKSKE